MRLPEAPRSDEFVDKLPRSLKRMMDIKVGKRAFVSTHAFRCPLLQAAMEGKRLPAAQQGQATKKNKFIKSPPNAAEAQKLHPTESAQLEKAEAGPGSSALAASTQQMSVGKGLGAGPNSGPDTRGGVAANAHDGVKIKTLKQSKKE